LVKVIRYCTAGFASAGLLIPVVLLAIDGASTNGWWPHWIPYLFPTDFMLGAASGVVDSFYYKMAALAIAMNVALYATVGFVLGLSIRLFLLLAKRLKIT
jgi:hypothetical protein